MHVVPTYPIDVITGNCENACMFLREKTRTKDGKTHRYWGVVENRRINGRRVVQRQVLCLGELNDNQRAGWVRTIEAVSGEESRSKQLALFPDDLEELPVMACDTIRVRLDKIELRHPHGNGAHAGWGCIYGICWNWTYFGVDVCRQAVRGQIG